MHNVGLLEATHHVRDRIGLANVGEELVAKALALGRAGDKAGDIDKLHRGRHDALGACNCGKGRKPRVRHLDDSDVGIDGAKRIVLGGHGRARERVEERRLADVRQPHDAALETHDFIAPLGPPCFSSKPGGLVCNSCIARSASPAASRGHTAKPREMASSIATRSDSDGGRRT